MILDYNGCNVSKFPIDVSIVIGFEFFFTFWCNFWHGYMDVFLNLVDIQILFFLNFVMCFHPKQ
jgi:hypothetical protein